MQNEEKIKSQWAGVDNGNIEKALHYLRQHETGIQTYLADCCAALCGVDTNEMFASSDSAYIAHVRWFYWHAYRYMTNDIFENMTRQEVNGGRTFKVMTINHGVNKMAKMIECDAEWNRRWTTIKRIIKLRDEEEKSIDSTITINISRELKDKVKIVIKEK